MLISFNPMDKLSSFLDMCRMGRVPIGAVMVNKKVSKTIMTDEIPVLVRIPCPSGQSTVQRFFPIRGPIYDVIDGSGLFLGQSLAAVLENWDIHSPAGDRELDRLLTLAALTAEETVRKVNSSITSAFQDARVLNDWLDFARQLADSESGVGRLELGIEYVTSTSELRIQACCVYEGPPDYLVEGPTVGSDSLRDTLILLSAQHSERLASRHRDVLYGEDGEDEDELSDEAIFNEVDGNVEPDAEPAVAFVTTDF